MSEIKRIEFGDVFEEDGRRQAYEVGDVTKLGFTIRKIAPAGDDDPWYRVLASPRHGGALFLLATVPATAVEKVFRDGDGP